MRQCLQERVCQSRNILEAKSLEELSYLKDQSSWRCRKLLRMQPSTKLWSLSKMLRTQRLQFKVLQIKFHPTLCQLLCFWQYVTGFFGFLLFMEKKFLEKIKHHLQNSSLPSTLVSHLSLLLAHVLLDLQHQQQLWLELDLLLHMECSSKEQTYLRRSKTLTRLSLIRLVRSPLESHL